MCYMGSEWAEDKFIEGIYMIQTGQCNNVFNRILSTWSRGNPICDIYNKVTGTFIHLVSPSNEARATSMIYISGSIFAIYNTPLLVDGMVDRLAGTIASNSVINTSSVEKSNENNNDEK